MPEKIILVAVIVICVVLIVLFIEALRKGKRVNGAIDAVGTPLFRRVAHIMTSKEYKEWMSEVNEHARRDAEDDKR